MRVEGEGQLKKVYYWSGRHEARCTGASQAADVLETGVPRVRVAVSSLYTHTYAYMHTVILEKKIMTQHTRHSQ